ncbi:MAG: methylmalonyl Co-A mutase-associated GTPase MeaB [Candidatus Dormibacteraeota bacterium]|nr:methylmalonyl Co-A mutase-associated GTPase MeaB [Candidatus Dormibacteraeota bacterium]
MIPIDKDALLGGDIRSLARAISLIERGGDGVGGLLDELWQARPDQGMRASQVVGLTGPPGSGKSTMADALIRHWRDEGRRVAVLAVDPNSPFTGGAILGDRVRMQRHALDQGVFIRSMGARGHLGGVSLATRGAVRLLDALGWEMVLVETVGVGQSELEICEIADTVVVVTTPGAGDGVQVIKAGVTEIADVFAVNKADLPGVDRVARELRDMIRLSQAREGWKPAVVLTTATNGADGVRDLARMIDEHHGQIERSGELRRRAAVRLREEVVELVALRAGEFTRCQFSAEQGPPGSEDPRRADPTRLAETIFDRLTSSKRNMDGSAAELTAASRRDL